MNPAIKLSLAASGIFLMTGLLSGILKYRRIMTSAEHRAPVYVDIAHRASLLYSFAALFLLSITFIPAAQGILKKKAKTKPFKPSRLMGGVCRTISRNRAATIAIALVVTGMLAYEGTKIEEYFGISGGFFAPASPAPPSAGFANFDGSASAQSDEYCGIVKIVGSGRNVMSVPVVFLFFSSPMTFSFCVVLPRSKAM